MRQLVIREKDRIVSLLTRDAVTFVTADNACDIKPLAAEFGIQLTPMREGLKYLARRAQ